MSQESGLGLWRGWIWYVWPNKNLVFFRLPNYYFCNQHFAAGFYVFKNVDLLYFTCHYYKVETRVFNKERWMKFTLIPFPFYLKESTVHATIHNELCVFFFTVRCFEISRHFRTKNIKETLGYFGPNILDNYENNKRIPYFTKFLITKYILYFFKNC